VNDGKAIVVNAVESETVGTLCACDSKAPNNQYVNDGKCVVINAVESFTGSSHAQYVSGVETLRANGGDLGGGSETLVTAIQGNLIGRDAGGPHGIGVAQGGPMYTLTKTDQHAVAFRKSKRAQTADDDETWVDDGIANTLNGFDTGDARTTHAVASGRATPMIAFHPTQDPISSTDGSTHALGCGSSQGCATVAVAVDLYNHSVSVDGVTTTLTTTGGGTKSGLSVMSAMSVRRLTPTECERLQGFPDGWTDGQADSHRYKQLGNAVTVNVAEWIARRAKRWMTK
jgi:DNA (cytosine-5)-methyltransferase 1